MNSTTTLTEQELISFTDYGVSFTQERLESMTDLQLNMVAANNYYGCYEVAVAQSLGDSVEVICNGVTVDSNYNPCRRWTDCAVFFDEYSITFNPADSGGEWLASSKVNLDNVAMDKNPKRAVTIVYILAKQESRKVRS